MERTADFITMVNTGEKPDATCCGVLFNDGNKNQIVLKIEGNGLHLINLIASAVEQLGSSLVESDGTAQAAYFADKVGTALVKGCGKDAMLMATLISAAKMKDALGEMTDEEEEE